MFITIQELLINRGLKATDKIKLVRHKDTRKGGTDVYALYRKNKAEFLAYQSAQKSEDKYKGADYIVSFIGEGGTRARFIGVYKILAKHPIDKKHRVSKEDRFYYEMEEDTRFAELKERIIIDWGKSRSWYQWFDKQKEVLEISPGLCNVQFTDYLDLVLTFDDLSEMVKNENRYPEWKKLLSSIFGVYVICDTSKNGKLYIGSAYDKEGGVWKRWSDYVATNGHCNNKSLKKMIDKDPTYARNFTFSLVAVLSKSSTPDAVIKKESIYKEKFGTRITGLNNN